MKLTGSILNDKRIALIAVNQGAEDAVGKAADLLKLQKATVMTFDNSEEVCNCLANFRPHLTICLCRDGGEASPWEIGRKNPVICIKSALPQDLLADVVVDRVKEYFRRIT